MTLQDELIEVGKEKLTQVKVFLDELEVQMALGKSEAKEVFEKERKNFMKYVADQKDQFRKNTRMSENHRLKLMEKFQALELVLDREEVTSEKKFEMVKKATLHVIYELELALKEAFGDVGLLMQERLEQFKGKLDTYRISLALGEYEDLAGIESKKEEVRVAVDDVLEKLKKEETASEKIDHFTEEINMSVGHLKKAFSELFS
jgi:hypothetical protein